MMKSILVLFFALFVLSPIAAQNWYTDIAIAKEIAVKKNKTIILVFQGSDWCAPCIKLDRDVWNTDLFKTYANDHYVMLQADFPRRKKNKLSQKQIAENVKLAEKYNKNGVFPFVVILDKTGKVLGETGYKKYAPKKYIKHLNTFIN